MRSKRWWKKSSVSGMWSKIIACVMALVVPLASIAAPPITDIPLPPVSFTHVEDKSILEDIGLAPGPAWCYDVEANAIIITAPARERAKCELKLMYELEKQKVKHDYAIDKLKLRMDTLRTQHAELDLIKNREIERLTEVALNRPNDHWYLFAGGGFLVGVATAVGIVFLVK